MYYSKPLVSKIDRKSLMKFHIPESAEQEIRPLYAYCFGEFRVFFTLNHQELQWRTKKARELFAYLIHMEGKWISRHEAITVLWPEVEIRRGISAFHNILYTIRQKLAQHNIKGIIECSNRKYRINMDLVATDLEYMHLVAESVAQENLEQLMPCVEMFSKYYGRYLESIDALWCVEWTEYFDMVYVKGCFLIGKYLMEHRRYEHAIVYLNVGLSVDSYMEKLAAMLILCYGKLRDLRGVKRQYEKYAAILESDLGIEHSEEIENAFQKALRGEL